MVAVVLHDRIACRECMTCEKLAMHARDGLYFCSANGEDIDLEIVDDFMCPVWCPDLIDAERFLAALL